MSFTFYASLPASAWAGELTIAQVIAAALAAGSVSVLFTTAYRVLLPSLVTPEELIEGNAKLQGSAAAAAIGVRGALSAALLATPAIRSARNLPPRLAAAALSRAR